MSNLEEKAAKILEECGFVNTILKGMEINEKIRDLEEFARTQRPSTAKKTEPLTKFLPSDMAKTLQDLRKERIKNRQKMDRSTICSRRRISEEGIVLIKTKKGMFAAEKKEKEKEEKQEEEMGLSALFG